MIFYKCLGLLLLLGTLHLTQGKEYVGGVEGLKERIEENSRSETPCSLFVGLVTTQIQNIQNIQNIQIFNINIRNTLQPLCWLGHHHHHSNSKSTTQIQNLPPKKLKAAPSISPPININIGMQGEYLQGGNRVKKTITHHCHQQHQQNCRHFSFFYDMGGGGVAYLGIFPT